MALLPFDPLLLLASLGLVALLAGRAHAARRATTSPGDPHYYVKRQAVYFVVGARADGRRSRGIDYSRLRELKYVLYAC